MTFVHGTMSNRMPSEEQLNGLDTVGAILAVLITLGPLAATAIFG